ncbi:hypothetical protein HK096_010591 [Nowakowskiella sp. JEL0078]|nr:hypothetical protein HK096_010591 [Nowakowskiella sp. JEL0078]
MVAAHFNLYVPTPRGNNDDTFFDAPCGGFNTVSAGRTIVPYAFGVNLTNVDAEDANFTVKAVFGNGLNLQNNSFTTSLYAGLAKGLVNTIANITFANVSPRPADGSNATIQIYYDGGIDID